MQENVKHYDRMPYGFCIGSVPRDRSLAAPGYVMEYMNPVALKMLGINSKDEISESRRILREECVGLSDAIYDSAYNDKCNEYVIHFYSIAKYVKLKLYPYEEGLTACILEDITDERFWQSVKNATLKNISELYYVNLRYDSFERLIPNGDIESGRYSDAVDRHIANIVDDGDASEVNEFLNITNICRELKEKEHIEKKYRRICDGENKWYMTTITIIERRDYEPYSVIISITDINDMVMQEIRLQNELSDALLQARKANNAKSDFLSIMSHDIRTPLNAIIGMTTLAKGYGDAGTQLFECVEKIDISSKYLLNLVDQILDMSYIESGNLKLSYERVNLGKLLDDVKTLAIGQIKSRHQELICEWENVYETFIMSDKGRLTQILLNLINNASKYSEDKKTIDFKCFVKDDGDNSYVTFKIADEGIGMSETFLDSLYEPFAREIDSRVSPVAGNGLGMTIVKKIVDMLNGTIEVKSSKGSGTVFTICISFDKAVDEKSLREGRGLEEIIEKRRIRAIIMEDNELNAYIASEILSHLGVDNDIAADGELGYNMFLNSPEGRYDALFVDLQMPGLDGVEVTKAVRALKRSDSDIPIFAMTANVFTEDIKRTKDAGMNEHIGKPIDVETLKCALKRWFPYLDIDEEFFEEKI